uniref:Uncharacterized protein TCIL3000_4_580 n=1 Tax=Trypanosoma congolense (strain IL3000) TaxID=1068625 RepID=G0UKS0_TRYCI|nr:unnamed protein product [Trypanosoma congolense IL3000]
MKDVTVDVSGTFLLLTFLSGAFEVWNIEESRIIYTYEGKPVASASWAPQKFVSVLAGMRGAPEILLIVFADGTISFWTVSWDQVVPNRDAVPMFPSGSPLRVMCTPTKEVSVLLDGGGAISVVCANMSGLHVYPLKDIPSGRVATALAVSKSENAPPSGDVAARPDTEAPVEYLAVTFADGALGVWNVTTKERVSFSTSPGINIKARRVTWLRDVIVVLTETGNVAVLDKSLTTVNSSVYSKALRRPLQSGAFFLPEHRTYIQGTLETQVTSRSVPNSTRAVFDHPPSHLVRDIPLERLPCRGPFGQVITTGISTLARELELYRKTMIPKRISDSIRRACAQRRVDEIALLVSCFFGQQDRERLWYQICLRRQLHSGVPGPVSSGFQASVPERKKLSNETWAPIPYYRAGRFSEVFSLSEAVFCNHVHLNERRTEALERYKREGQDMFAPRFLTARELLKLQQPQKAIDVLMDVNHESDQFPHLSDFAVAIAASVAALKGPSSELLTLTTSRVSALLRARGELDSAVDKYLLSGHYYEAVKTLQMSGRWSGAAALAKLSPINAQHQRELLSRWCSHLMRRGEVMEAARILILLSLSFQAIVLLGESSQFKDIAGLLAIVFLEDASYSTDEHLHEPVTLLTRESDSSEALSLQEVLLDALMDYANLLTSTGNVASAQIVMEYVASLKSRSRGGVSNDTSVS